MRIKTALAAHPVLLRSRGSIPVVPILMGAVITVAGLAVIPTLAKTRSVRI